MKVLDFISEDVMLDETVCGIEVVLSTGGTANVVRAYIGNSEDRQAIRWFPLMVVIVVCEVAL